MVVLQVVQPILSHSYQAMKPAKLNRFMAASDIYRYDFQDLSLVKELDGVIHSKEPQTSVLIREHLQLRMIQPVLPLGRNLLSVTC